MKDVINYTVTERKLSLSGLCDRCCPPLLSPFGNVGHSTVKLEKVRESDAKWATGELSMKSPSTFLLSEKNTLDDETRA